jgi:hypothetical protein
MPLSIGSRAGRARLWITGVFDAAFYRTARSQPQARGTLPTWREMPLEHPKHLRPYRDGGQKQAYGSQRDSLFQH